MNTSAQLPVSLDTPHADPSHANPSPTPARDKRRGILAGSLVITACAAACALPLLAGAGVISLGAGFLGGTTALVAVALASLGAIAGILWWRAHTAGQASAAEPSAAEPSDDDAPDACQSDHSCAGSGCGCS